VGCQCLRKLCDCRDEHEVEEQLEPAGVSLVAIMPVFVQRPDSGKLREDRADVTE
jgi:hypothetical protein